MRLSLSVRDFGNDDDAMMMAINRRQPRSVQPFCHSSLAMMGVDRSRCDVCNRPCWQVIQVLDETTTESNLVGDS